jgi:hypothetical protein
MKPRFAIVAQGVVAAALVKEVGRHAVWPSHYMAPIGDVALVKREIYLDEIRPVSQLGILDRAASKIACAETIRIQAAQARECGVCTFAPP